VVKPPAVLRVRPRTRRPSARSSPESKEDPKLLISLISPGAQSHVCIRHEPTVYGGGEGGDGAMETRHSLLGVWMAT